MSSILKCANNKPLNITEVNSRSFKKKIISKLGLQINLESNAIFLNIILLFAKIHFTFKAL
jgi:hypothetical protein